MVDARTAFTCYYNHASLLKYFATSGPGTYYCIYYPQTVSAYKAKNFNRPACSFNVSAWKVGPAKIEDGRISSSYTLEGFNDLRENIKLKLLIHLFILKHWGKEKANGISLNYGLGDKDEMVEKIWQLQRQLVQEKLLAEDAPTAVQRIDAVLRSGTESRRPGVVQQLYDYEINPFYSSDITLKLDDTWYDSKFPIQASWLNALSSSLIHLRSLSI